MRKPLERYLGLEYPALLVAEPEGGYTARFGAPTQMNRHPDLKECVAVRFSSLAEWSSAVNSPTNDIRR